MGQNAEKIIFVASNTHKYVAKEGGCNLICRRAPHGARGLKHTGDSPLSPLPASRPARGAWIETPQRLHHDIAYLSRPARGAWIETARSASELMNFAVAPRTGRLD